MTFMENDKSSIRTFIKQINHPLFFAKKPYHNAIKDDGYILNNYSKGVVDEDMLIRFIKKSWFFPPLRLLMPDILYHTHENSITDKVFWICCNYPGRFRKTLLNLLSHMWLTQEQLLVLNQLTDTPEAFCKLFYLYVTNDTIAIDAFVSFLSSNQKQLRNMNLGSFAKQNSLTLYSDKMVAAKKYIEEHGM